MLVDIHIQLNQESTMTQPLNFFFLLQVRFEPHLRQKVAANQHIQSMSWTTKPGRPTIT